MTSTDTVPSVEVTEPTARDEAHPQCPACGCSNGTVRFAWTVDEIAASMRLAKNTVYRAIRAGDLPALRINRDWRIDEAGLQQWFDLLKERTAAELGAA